MEQMCGNFCVTQFFCEGLGQYFVAKYIPTYCKMLEDDYCYTNDINNFSSLPQFLLFSSVLQLFTFSTACALVYHKHLKMQKGKMRSMSNTGDEELLLLASNKISYPLRELLFILLVVQLQAWTGEKAPQIRQFYNVKKPKKTKKFPCGNDQNVGGKKRNFEPHL